LRPPKHPRRISLSKSSAAEIFSRQENICTFAPAGVRRRFQSENPGGADFFSKKIAARGHRRFVDTKVDAKFAISVFNLIDGDWGDSH
jgi:hypothetical protein